MGGTVFRHPAGYAKLASQIKSDLKTLKGHANVKVGVLLNHAYLPGVINRGPDSPPYPCLSARPRR